MLSHDQVIAAFATYSAREVELVDRMLKEHRRSIRELKKKRERLQRLAGVSSAHRSLLVALALLASRQGHVDAIAGWHTIPPQLDEAAVREYIDRTQDGDQLETLWRRPT